MIEPKIAQIISDIESHHQNQEMVEKGYSPVFSASSKARVVIIGQAPGIRAQESQIPWNDKSGEQLRRWLDVNDQQFYDSEHFALVPMDFYFPGHGTSGDLPPRKGFAELWHPKLFACMPNVKLRLLVGQYAQKYYLKDKQTTLTATVRDYQRYLDQGFLPLPHPSPRNNIWKKNNPWFEEEVVPVLQRQVKRVLLG